MPRWSAVSAVLDLILPRRCAGCGAQPARDGDPPVRRLAVRRPGERSPAARLLGQVSEQRWEAPWERPHVESVQWERAWPEGMWNTGPESSADPARLGAPICAACLNEVRGVPARRMPDPSPPGLPPCWSATVYDGVARRLIVAYKERGRTALAPVLAACVAGVAARALGPHREPVWLVPVPSARAARRRRGHDPVRRIAAEAARELSRQGVPVRSAPMLRPRRMVADQASLSSSERAANLAGAYRVADGAGGPWWPAQRRTAAAVLVDDVVTTGATLAEAARALREAGVAVRLAITIAATRRARAR